MADFPNVLGTNMPDQSTVELVTSEGTYVPFMAQPASTAPPGTTEAVVFVPTANTQSNSIQSNRLANQHGTNSTEPGITNLGSDTTDALPAASGNYATISGGDQNQVSANYASVGGGLNNSASGAGAVIAGGQNNVASGPSSTVSGGNGNVSSGSDSYVEGDGNTSSNTGSHAEGQSTTASGGGAHSQGFGTQAIGNYSDASGAGSIANAVASAAGGENSYASYEGCASWASGPLGASPTPSNVAQMSTIVMRGKSPGVAAGEVVTLGYGSASPPGNTGFGVQPNKAYLVIVEAVVNIPSIPVCGAHILKGAFRVNSSGTVLTLAGLGTSEVFGDATYITSASSMALVSGVGPLIVVQWTSGYDSPVVAAIAATIRIVEQNLTD
jgi:hypothetical protein